MIGLNVSSNIKQVSAQFAQFATVPGSKVEKATIRALNRAVDQSQTEANRRIRDRYNVKANVVAKAMKKRYASGRGVSLFSELRVQGARIPLIEFSASERRVRSAKGPRRGVTVRVMRGGQRKIVKGGFIATARGGRGIFKRKGRARYPIEYLRSVSIPRAFMNDAVIAAVKKIAGASFVRNFEQQVRFLGIR